MGKTGRAAVVVLGDIGRSPRMQYHALSLASQASLKVDIVAYGGSHPHAAVLNHPSIYIHKMAQWPKFMQKLPWVFRYLVLLLKPLFQFLILLWHLCVKIPAPDFFLVQNPPSIPTLAAVKWASWIRHSAFIVDWHNFGYTLLRLSLGRGSRFVALYHWFEKHYGQLADGSLCVTKAMQHELAQNWGIRATVLYDQPPEFFHPASMEEKHRLFHKLDKEFRHSEGGRDCISHGYRHMRTDEQCDTLFTIMSGVGVIENSTRPALVVSSTSWFGGLILLEGLPDLDMDLNQVANKNWNEVGSSLI